MKPLRPFATSTQSGESRERRQSLRLTWLLSLGLAVALATLATKTRPVCSSLTSQAQSPPPTTSGQVKPSAAGAQLHANDHSSSANLIPVDQPVLSSSNTNSKGGQAEVQSRGAHEQEMAGSQVRPAGVYQALQAAGQDQLGQFVQQADGAESGAEEQQQQQQQSSSSLVDLGQEFRYGQKVFGESELLDKKQAAESADGAYLAINQTPTSDYQSQQQQQQIVAERRFGLFKKQHQQHFGSPMSANLALNPYLSDCERCLAGLNAGQSADLQQLDPLPAPPPPPPSQLPVLPSQAHQAFGAQPFGPLKNKLFMKFPFFMKPISIGDPAYNSGHDSFPYQWHQHQHQHQFQQTNRPQMASAMFIRPAPAYNCIQAAPPILAAGPSSQEVALTKAQHKQYPHQHQHQQTTYSSSQY